MIVAVRKFPPGAILVIRNGVRSRFSFRYVTVHQVAGHQAERLHARFELNKNISRDRPVQTDQEHSRRLIEGGNPDGIPRRRHRLAAEFHVILVGQREAVLLVLIEGVLKLDRQAVGCVLRAF